jgi:predicted Zn finger-like uncharacterized protein
MSLATRCTACGTVFRVVQDQLKVSEGWVRCGRCKEVFNALEGLFDLQRDAPPEWRPAAATHPPSAHADTAPEVPASGALLSVPAEGERLAEPTQERDAPIEAAVIAVPLPPADAADEADSEPRDSRDFADARFNIELALDDEAATAAEPAPPANAAEPARPLAAPPEEEPEAPAFLREAAQAERWRRPSVRIALAAISLLLALTFAAQWAFHFRDTFAARWPAARPLLAAGCAALGCRIELPRRIEDVAVESSALTRGQGDALRLVVALRNRGPLKLALPHLELSLTDVNGELIARRALAAADFRGAEPSLAPAGEITLRALLANPGGRVAGYTVEVFYP